jgi:hypothetical protein
VFIASLLRNAAARLIPRFNRPATTIENSTATPSPSSHPTPHPGPGRTQRLVDRIQPGIGVVPVEKTPDRLLAVVISSNNIALRRCGRARLGGVDLNVFGGQDLAAEWNS